MGLVNCFLVHAASIERTAAGWEAVGEAVLSCRKSLGSFLHCVWVILVLLSIRLAQEATAENKAPWTRCSMN